MSFQRDLIEVKGFHIDRSKLVGKSQYQVYEATKYDRKFAAKHMHDKNPDHLKKNELCLHDLAKVHENVLQVETYCSDGKDGTWVFSPLCTYGNLINYSKEHKNDFHNQTVRLDIMKQASEGLKFLHSLNKVHRDIKPGNILLTKDKDKSLLVQISDFGEALDTEERSMKTAVGTRPFAAPEIHMNVTPSGPGRLHKYDSKVDIFSMGLTFLAIIQGHNNLVPKGKNLLHTPIGLKMLEDNSYRPVEIESDDDDFTRAIKKIIMKMVELDAGNRLSAAEVRQELDAIATPDEVR